MRDAFTKTYISLPFTDRWFFPCPYGSCTCLSVSERRPRPTATRKSVLLHDSHDRRDCTAHGQRRAHRLTAEKCWTTRITPLRRGRSSPPSACPLLLLLPPLPP